MTDAHGAPAVPGRAWVARWRAPMAHGEHMHGACMGVTASEVRTVRIIGAWASGVRTVQSKPRIEGAVTVGTRVAWDPHCA